MTGGRCTMADMYQAIVDRSAAGERFALVTVLQAIGSTPSKPGAKALINSAGQIDGTVGGGQLEARAQQLAIEAIRSHRPLVFDFSSAGESAQGTSPICGGTVRLLIDPTVCEHRETYAHAAEALHKRERGTLLTTFGPDPQRLVQVRYVHDETAAIQHGWLPDGRETFIEPLLPPPLLLIAGGGHVGQALALHASLAGFQVTVIDDRAEFADPLRYPQQVTTRCGDVAAELSNLAADDETYIAIVTRGHEQDRRALAACINKPAGYIGMIGSRRKVALICEELQTTGAATEEQLSRLHAPIGLDIGAQTVPEIAISILAELIAVRRGKSLPCAVPHMEGAAP